MNRWDLDIMHTMWGGFLIRQFGLSISAGGFFELWTDFKKVIREYHKHNKTHRSLNIRRNSYVGWHYIQTMHFANSAFSRC